MDNKADIKAIMAHFNNPGGGAASTSDSTPKTPLHPALSNDPPSKTALHPTISNKPPNRSKKPILEASLSGNAISIPPKPNFLKNSVSTNSAPEVREVKALASKFSNASGQEDSKSSFVKQFPFNASSSSSSSSQEAEAKSFVPRLPLHKPSLSSTLPESKPAFQKPPPALVPKPHATGAPKPPWVKEDGPSSPPPKLPTLQKPSSSFAKLQKQIEDGEGGATTDHAPSFPSPAPKPSNFRTAQGMFNKDVQSEDSGAREGIPFKLPLGASNSTPPRPPANKKPSFVRKPPGPTSQAVEDGDVDGPSGPKRNPLPNIWALGKAPAKPNRPPKVNLEGFRRGSEASSDGPAFTKSGVPPPPASHPSNLATPPLPPPSTSHPSNLATPPLPPPSTSHPSNLATPPQPLAPILPPRPTAAIIQPDQDENYDDIGPSRTTESGSDEEMYEDLDERWGAAELKEQEKKREKDEKKRQETEKKEQKERERKEQEARKKFKLSGPMSVIHSVKARTDSKGGKLDLVLKQGDSIDIIRVLDNPEGRWLGRTKDGSYGYVKNELVQIDFGSLKGVGQGVSLPSQQEYDQEVYDDVDCSGGVKGPGVVLPPPPEEDGDLYDDLEDVSPLGPQDSRVSSKVRGLQKMLKDWRRPPGSTNQLPPPAQFTPAGSSADQSASDQEIYDDIETPGFSPPPLASSHAQPRPKLRAEEMDPKKLKKFEKEEKEFRKKFKFEGQIVVLYQVTIVSSLSGKKGGNKDLQLSPGERLDVVKATDNKLICRNNEGKFGYVQTSNIVAEDADIYDDIGDDCIYDND